MKKLNVLYLILFSYTFFSCKETGKKSNPVYIDTFGISERANSFFYQKEYSKAKLAYDTLILIDSLKGEYYFKRGYSRIMLLDDDPGATLDFFKALKNNYRKKESAYLNIGMLYRTKGDYDSAIYFYNECLKIDSGNIKAQRGKKEVIQIQLNNLQ